MIHVVRKNAVVAGLEAEFGISHLHACEIANGWEHDAGRRGVDQSAPDFWTSGRAWMVRQATGRNARPRTTDDLDEGGPRSPTVESEA